MHMEHARRAISSGLFGLLITVTAGAQTFPVLAWLGPPADETSVERYQELAEAGFTHSFSGFPSVDSLLVALGVAEETGVKLIAACPELRQTPAETVNRIKNHPALAGYYLRDEPGADAFPELGEWVRAIQAADPEHFCYINLFPTYADADQLGVETYEAYVNAFLDTVPVEILSFDHYPILESGGELRLRDDYYRNLAIIARIAGQRNKPFWAFALSVPHGPYPMPTATHLRLQIHSNLLYGAKGIQYFTYWTPQSSQWDFHDAPISVNGERTRTYRVVKKVNSELAPVRDFFVDAKLLQTGHVGESIPEGVRSFVLPEPFTECSTESAHAIMAHAERDGIRYLSVLNPSLDEFLNIELSASSPLILVHGTREQVRIAGGKCVAGIGPGAIIVLRW